MTPRHNRVIIRPSSEGYDVGGGGAACTSQPPIFFSKIIKISSKQCFKKQKKEKNAVMFVNFLCVYTLISNNKITYS